MRIAVAMLLALLAGPVAAADCPPDKPHKRQVIDYTKTLACNAHLVNRLSCPIEGTCFYQKMSTCPPAVTYDICLSEDELSKAQK